MCIIQLYNFEKILVIMAAVVCCVVNGATTGHEYLPFVDKLSCEFNDDSSPDYSDIEMIRA